MSDAPHRPRGLWFEEFTEGMSIETRGRTITEADLVNFAGVSGDFNPLHTDAEYARNSEFGQRVAHGTLIFSVATGLAYQLGILEGTIMAFRSFEMKLSKPVFIGDTIKVSLSVKERKAVRAANGGMVTLEVKVFNQNGVAVQKGEWTVLMRSKPAESKP